MTVLERFHTTRSLPRRQREGWNPPNKTAGLDVHKKMLAVVVTDGAVEGAFQFERRKFGTWTVSCVIWPPG